MAGSVLKPELRAAPTPLDLQNDESAEYRRFRFKTPAPSAADSYASAQAVRQSASGSCLHIHKINGPGIIQVKLGDNNPWIDIAEGMTLYRTFDVFYIRDVFDYSTGIIHLTEVIIYTSKGPFIDMPFKTHGFKPTPHVGNATLVAGTWVTLEVMIGGAGSKQEFAGDLTGGAFLLRCSQDSATGAQLKYAKVNPVPAYVAGSGYKIFPGEWVSVEVDSKIGRMSGDVNSELNRWAWIISPLEAAKTTNVNFIIGARNDLSDIDYGSDPDVNLRRVVEMG